MLDEFLSAHKRALQTAWWILATFFLGLLLAMRQGWVPPLTDRLMLWAILMLAFLVGLLGVLESYEFWFRKNRHPLIEWPGRIFLGLLACALLAILIMFLRRF